MQILGHELIDFTPLFSIEYIEDIKNQDGILFFEFNPELIKYCKDKNHKFALHIFNQTEAILGNGAKADILVCHQDLALDVQELAEYYLFDSKIAILINDEDEIEKAIKHKVDMAILPSAIN